jgi:hypothetical protein
MKAKRILTLRCRNEKKFRWGNRSPKKAFNRRDRREKPVIAEKGELLRFSLRSLAFLGDLCG